MNNGDQNSGEVMNALRREVEACKQENRMLRDTVGSLTM